MKLLVQVNHCYIFKCLKKKRNCPLCWCAGVGVADLYDSGVHIKFLKWLRSAACVTHKLERVCKQFTTVPHQQLCSWATDACGYQVICQLCKSLPFMVMNDANVLYLLVVEPVWWSRPLSCFVSVCVPVMSPPNPQVYVAGFLIIILGFCHSVQCALMKWWLF